MSNTLTTKQQLKTISHPPITSNEYLILSEISEDGIISQRALSKRIGVSLGTVNTLLTKMVKEGMIKTRHVTGKQVAYMLTPKGILEKSKKTVSYLKNHYKAIYTAKENVKIVMNQALDTNDCIYILKQSGELGEIVDIAIEEFEFKNKLCVITNINSIDAIKTESTIINATENKLSLDIVSSHQVVDVFL